MHQELKLLTRQNESQFPARVSRDMHCYFHASLAPYLQAKTLIPLICWTHCSLLACWASLNFNNPKLGDGYFFPVFYYHFWESPMKKNSTFNFAFTAVKVCLHYSHLHVDWIKHQSNIPSTLACRTWMPVWCLCCCFYYVATIAIEEN
jgi:hypothetical protein